MSICYMIFIAEPYYNEPGYESRKPSSDKNIQETDSFKYNSNIRFHTIDTAVLKHLQSPDPDFGVLIRRILRHRWPSSEQTFMKWAAQETSTCRTKCMKSKIDEIRKLIGCTLGASLNSNITADGNCVEGVPAPDVPAEARTLDAPIETAPAYDATEDLPADANNEVLNAWTPVDPTPPTDS